MTEKMLPAAVIAAAFVALALAACGDTTTTEVPVCPLTECGGNCVDTNNDPSNCGGCGTACAMNEVCSGGMCTGLCSPGQIDCASACVDPNTDRAFCGASGDCMGGNAGTPCADGEICDGAAVCALSCQSGLIDCAGTCTDPMTNADFCGATGDCMNANAGAACVPGELCTSGTCMTFASCAAISNANLARGDGVYTIDRGDGPISVYCDMVNGTTYVSFAVGDYNNSYTDYVNPSIATWQTVPFQQAFLWFYNTHDGLQNLQVGWTGTNCCIALTSSQRLGFGASTNTRLYTLAGTALCSNTQGWNLGRYHIGEALLTHLAPPIALNYFVQNPPTTNSTCSDGDNPGIFVESFQ